MSIQLPAPIQAHTIDLFIQDGQLIAAYGEQQKRFNALPFLIAKIMDVLALILPCFFQGAAEIRVEDKVYYISRSDIKNQLTCQEQDRPCLSANGLGNADALKILVQNYFAPDLYAIRQENSHMLSTLVPIHNVQEDAAGLAEAFLELKNRMIKSSGYHLSLTENTRENAWNISIHAVGKDDGEIIPPPLSGLCQCTCCHTCYEHTLKTQQNPLLATLNEALAAQHMFAVLSHSGNLLLIPDTRMSHIRAADYPHLFALNEEQLRNAFHASLQTVFFLSNQFPAYRTRIACHIGVDGMQTVPILHIRFEKLPRALREG